MTRSITFKVIMALVLVGALVGLGYYAYQLGFANGATQENQVESGSASAPVYPYYGMHFFHPFMGFGFLGCLVPLGLLFLFFCAMRGLFWHGPRRWGGMHHGPWGRSGTGHPDWSDGFPPVAEEWHRKMHDKQAEKSTPEQV
jgi:hypothetical protein